MSIETIDGKRVLRWPPTDEWEQEFMLEELDGETFVVVHKNHGNTTRIPMSIISALLKDRARAKLGISR